MTTPAVTCPRCGEPSPPRPENRSWPFCSKRCRLIDLGAWLDEAFRVPGEPAPPDEN